MNLERAQIQIGEYIRYFEANPTIPSILRYIAKEIPSPKLLISLNQIPRGLGNMIIFDISQKVAKKIYTFEEVSGGKIDSTWMNNNQKTSLLFNIDKAISCTHHSTLFVFLSSCGWHWQCDI